MKALEVTEAPNKYRNFVEKIVADGLESPLWNVCNGLILGNRSFIKELLRSLNDSLLEWDHVSYCRDLRSSVEAKDIMAILSKHFGGVSYSAIPQFQSRFSQEVSKDKSVKKEFEKLEKVMSPINGWPHLFWNRKPLRHGSRSLAWSLENHPFKQCYIEEREST